MKILHINTKVGCLLVLLNILATNVFSQTDTTKLFVFGNSTIDHRFKTIPTPSDETTVPHWLKLLSIEGSYEFKAGGQFGFLPQFADTPYISQWGYDTVAGVWDSDTEPFSDADITTVMITGGNFIQYQAPYLPYVTDTQWTPLSATNALLDWVAAREDSVKYYIYENWPDMGSFLGSGFPPNATELATYNNYTVNAFHDWWLEYHDSLLIMQPQLNIRMIPVGSIMSKIYTNLLTNQVPVLEIYEDDAPHGRATTYFIAALISYMAIYEEPAPLSYTVPSIIHPTVQSNYTNIVNFIWSELQGFNLSDGSSRVFCGPVTNQTDLLAEPMAITLYPNPTEDYFQISGDLANYSIEILNSSGLVFQNISTNLSMQIIEIGSLPPGMYFVKMINTSNGNISLEKIIKY